MPLLLLHFSGVWENGLWTIPLLVGMILSFLTAGRVSHAFDRAGAGERTLRRYAGIFQHIEHQPFVIFTTAYSQHAVSAFELGAVDYLMKPFGPARLAAAMERVRGAVGQPSSVDAIERLSGALGGGPITRLFVRVGSAIVPVPVPPAPPAAPAEPPEEQEPVEAEETVVVTANGCEPLTRFPRELFRK